MLSLLQTSLLDRWGDHGTSGYLYMRSLLGIGSITLSLALTSFAQQPAAVTVQPIPATPVASATIPAPAPSSNDRIGAGDLLDMSVADVPELTIPVRVSDQGTIAVPILGVLAVGDKTVQEAQDLIAQALLDKNVVRRPQVSLLIAEYSNQVVSVLGEVGRPSTFPLIGHRKLYDAISASGGLLPTASTQVTLLRRGQPEQTLTISTSVSAGPLEVSNVDLMPGDTIIVRRAGVVYVVGDVGRPGGFVMSSDHITALQALALAEGARPDAKLNSARIVHREGATVRERPVKLVAIMQAKSPDVLLGPDDVLFIPVSLPKQSAQGISDTVTRLLTAAIIYVR